MTSPGGGTTTGRAVQALAFSPDGGTLAVNSPGSIRLWNVTTGRFLYGPNGTTENFVRIGHSLLALVMGFFGGGLSRWLYDKGRGRGEGLAGATAGPAVGGAAGRQDG
jgi:hypothetical protein